MKPTPQVAPLHPWVWPEAPWRRIHIDFAGPFMGKMLFCSGGCPFQMARNDCCAFY